MDKSNSIPKVSVIMSVYNGARYLQAAIDSILQQTFNEFEFIIVNDASTDNSLAIICEYAKSDRRIRLVENEENIGLTRSLNKGLGIAQGKYIARQDADDVSLPERFEKQVATFEKHPDVVLVSCDMDVIDGHSNFVRRDVRSAESMWVKWLLIFYNHIGGHSQVMFRRETALQLGGYANDFRYSQDYEFWCRLSTAGDIVILPDVLHNQRLHNQRITSQKRTEQLGYALDQSKVNIHHLIGEEPTTEDVNALRKFWGGKLHGGFPEASAARSLSSLQWDLLKAFLKRNPGEKEKNRQYSADLKKVIGKQFVAWIASVSIFKLSERLQISSFAFSWSPLGVLKQWVRDLASRSMKFLQP